METFDDLFAVLERAGAEQYGQEAVSQLEHALQCAHWPEEAPLPLITAALLHDVITDS
jgi:predicted HD phosphohydrolase